MAKGINLWNKHPRKDTACGTRRDTACGTRRDMSSLSPGPGASVEDTGGVKGWKLGAVDGLFPTLEATLCPPGIPASMERGLLLALSPKSASPAVRMDKASREQVQLSTQGSSGVPERLWSITHPCPAPHTDPTSQSWLLTHNKISILFFIFFS